MVYVTSACPVVVNEMQKRRSSKHSSVRPMDVDDKKDGCKPSHLSLFTMSIIQPLPIISKSAANVSHYPRLAAPQVSKGSPDSILRCPTEKDPTVPVATF